MILKIVKVESLADIDRRHSLEQQCVKFASAIKSESRRGSRFAFFIFGEDGATAYLADAERLNAFELLQAGEVAGLAHAADADRLDVIALLKTWVTQMERGS